MDGDCCGERRLQEDQLVRLQGYAVETTTAATPYACAAVCPPFHQGLGNLPDLCGETYTVPMEELYVVSLTLSAQVMLWYMEKSLTGCKCGQWTPALSQSLGLSHEYRV